MPAPSLFTYPVRQFRQQGTSVQSQLSGPSVTLTKSGSSVPNFRDKIAKHINATSAYACTVVEHCKPMEYNISSYLQSSPTVAKSSQNCWGSACDNFYFIMASPSDKTAVDDIALKRLKSRLANDNARFKALAPLVESRELRGLVKQTAGLTGEMLQAALDLKHGRIKKFRKRFADAWLGWNFGMAPLVSDSINLAQAIANHVSAQDRVERYSGSNSASYNSRASIVRGLLNTGQSLVCIDSRSYTYTVKYTAGVHIIMSQANNLKSFNHSFGFEINDIVPAAWELLPFSWIADYFTTTGEFLDDVFSSPSGNTIYVCKSEKILLQLVSTGVVTFSSGQKGGSSNVTPGSSRYISYNRSALSSLPHRAFRIKTLDEIGVNSVKRLLNLVSVVSK